MKFNNRAPTALAMSRNAKVISNTNFGISINESPIVDSGTTSYMTTNTDIVYGAGKYQVPILLGDDSKVVADHRGTRRDSCSGEEGVSNVCPSNKFAALSLSMSLLSIYALAFKGIRTLSGPQRALLVDIFDTFA